MKALVYVTLKPDVLDPQGEAIRKACRSLGYASVGSVRQGKLFEIELEARSEPEARRLLEELSDKLLANTVIEDFRARGVLVGRPFPPLLEHLRVSVGTSDEMDRFMRAFKEIVVRTTA